MIDIYVPTYKRKTFRILELLKDKNIRLNLCVRRSEIENNFYEHLYNNPQINFVDLGNNICDIGDTRERIICFCQAHNIKYCIMLDDTVSDIYYKDSNYITDVSSSACLKMCIEQMKENEEMNVMFALSTEQRKHHAQDINTKYFLHCPAQGFIINTELCKQHNINFHSLKIVGSEDMAFFIDTLKAGLLTCTNRHINMTVETTLKQKSGGTHTDKYSVERKSDIYTSNLRKYVGNMYGVYFTKRYRHQIESQCCFTAFDYEYFIDVLIKYRDENKQIIDSQFKVKEDDYDEI